MLRTPETFKPEPAETFNAEFNAPIEEATKFMSKFGNFRYNGGGLSSNGDAVTHEGSRPDGTTIKIVVTKGSKYKLPAQIEQEYKVSLDKEKK